MSPPRFDPRLTPARHDLAAEFLPQKKRKSCLSTPRRPQNHHNKWLAARISRTCIAAHSRHHPGGKIHPGLVWNSHQTRITAATIIKPKTWLRLYRFRCPSRRAAASSCARYGLVRVSTSWQFSQGVKLGDAGNCSPPLSCLSIEIASATLRRFDFPSHVC